MSQENVEIVRASFEAFNAGRMDTDAVREWLHPDVIVVRGLEGWPEPAPFVGREAVIRQWERSAEPWDTLTLEPISIIDAGDRVVTRQLAHGVGKGPEVDVEFTTVSTVRNGKIFLIEYFWSHAEALETLGLSE
jgi:ketosteroid isomerase-like protein